MTNINKETTMSSAEMMKSREKFVTNLIKNYAFVPNDFNRPTEVTEIDLDAKVSDYNLTTVDVYTMVALCETEFGISIDEYHIRHYSDTIKNLMDLCCGRVNIDEPNVDTSDDTEAEYLNASGMGPDCEVYAEEEQPEEEV